MTTLVALTFDWDVVREHWGELRHGLWLTLEVAALGFVLACVLGLPVAVLRLSRSPLVRGIGAVWVGVLRGVPLIVVVYWLYNTAASRGWFVISEFRTGVLALGLTGSAYMAENYRAALRAVDVGQREAALAMGLSPAQSFWTVEVPQAARVVVAPSVNLLVGLLKAGTILSLIGLKDMFYVARTVAVDEFSPFELYTVAAVLIVGVTLVVAGFAALLERRLGRGHR